MYKVMTFGESHGKAIGCVIDSCPPGIYINLSLIQKYLNDRRPGTSKFVTQRNEQDSIVVLSGIYNCYTTGTPIAICVNNKDMRSNDYDNLIDIFRPGHADYTYFSKYGIRDHRGGGRSSARVTIALVIAGSVARLILNDFFNVKIHAYVYIVGSIRIPFLNFSSVVDLFIPNDFMLYSIKKYLSVIIVNKSSLGGCIMLVISNLVSGVGDPLFGKLNSSLTGAIMTLNAVRSVDIGVGRSVLTMNGLCNNDFICDTGFVTNNSGGILGGISTGQDVRLKVYIKPTSSIGVSQSTVNTCFDNVLLRVVGRHDPCVALRSVPIIESIAAIVVFDLILSQRVLRFY